MTHFHVIVNSRPSLGECVCPLLECHRNHENILMVSRSGRYAVSGTLHRKLFPKRMIQYVLLDSIHIGIT